MREERRGEDSRRQRRVKGEDKEGAREEKTGAGKRKTGEEKRRRPGQSKEER